MNEFNSINRVEIRGRVGTVRICPLKDATAASFSVMTEYLQKTHEGRYVVESTWHNVTALQGDGVVIDGLSRGALVHLQGRLRQCRYTAAGGTERIFTEIMASSLEVIEE